MARKLGKLGKLVKIGQVVVDGVERVFVPTGPTYNQGRFASLDRTNPCFDYLDYMEQYHPGQLKNIDEWVLTYTKPDALLGQECLRMLQEQRSADRRYGPEAVAKRIQEGGTVQTKSELAADARLQRRLLRTT